MHFWTNLTNLIKADNITLINETMYLVKVF